MKFYNKILVLLLLPLVVFTTKPVIAEPITEAYISTPEEFILYYAHFYNTDPNVLLKIGKCESNLDPNNRGDKGLAINIFQYHKGTWEEFEHLIHEDLDRNSYKDQAKMTAFIFANYPQLRYRWSTFTAYKNGGTYSFYSNLLKDHFVVHCK